MKTKRTEKTCRKVGYPSKAEARQALNDFGKERGSRRAYQCPHHDAETWHLTSEPPRASEPGDRKRIVRVCTNCYTILGKRRSRCYACNWYGAENMTAAEAEHLRNA